MGEPATVDRVRFHLRAILPATGGFNRDELRREWLAYQARLREDQAMIVDLSNVRHVIDRFTSLESETDFLSAARIGGSLVLLERSDIETTDFRSLVSTIDSFARIMSGDQPLQFRPSSPSFYLTPAVLGATNRSIGDYSITFHLGGDRSTVAAFYRVTSGGSTHHYRLLVRRTLSSGRIEFTDFYLNETAMRAALSQISGTDVNETIRDFGSLTRFVANRFRADTSPIVALNHSPQRGFVQIGSLPRGQAWYRMAYTGSTTNFLDLASAISAVPANWSHIVSEDGRPTWARLQGRISIPGVSGPVSIAGLGNAAVPSDVITSFQRIHSYHQILNDPTVNLEGAPPTRGGSIRLLTQFTVRNPHQGNRDENRRVYFGRFNGIDYFSVVSWHMATPAPTLAIPNPTPNPVYRICAFRINDLPEADRLLFSPITHTTTEITQDMQERLQIFFGVTNTVENRLATLADNGQDGQTFEQRNNRIANILTACGAPLRENVITVRVLQP